MARVSEAARQASRDVGLNIMNYRANMVGGSLKVQPNASRGITVTCMFPIQAALNRSEAHGIPNATRDRKRKKYRVLLVDDHPIVRQGLALLIDREPDLSVCGEADGAHSAFHAIATLRPDIVVLDISLNGPDGLDVLKEIRTKARESAGSDSFHA